MTTEPSSTARSKAACAFHYGTPISTCPSCLAAQGDNTRSADESLTMPDLLAEAKRLRDALYYGAPPSSQAEKDANRLGRVLFLIEKQVTHPYGD